MDPRLQGAIASPRLQSQVGELIRLALAALDNLKQLDEGLYERFVASRAAPADAAANAASLRALWDSTFAGLLRLLDYCRSLEPDGVPEPVGDEPSAVFDFGDLEGGAPAGDEGGGAAGGGLELAPTDIGDLLEGIDEHVAEPAGDRWAKALEKIGSIEYGLRSQHAEGAQRLGVALGAGEINQVLGLLDDTQSSASEGVHALVAAVYEAFVPEVNAASVVPGYLTSLGRALLVRRGLAELAATLAPFNDALQGDVAARHEAALASARAALHAFVGSVVCRAMRPADRWQLVELERELAEQPLAAARLTSEGLVKYLDSLASINQREVLLLHDQRALEAMREALSSARGLVDVSPRTALELLDQAYQAALRLRGRAPATDRMLAELERYSPMSSNPGEAMQFLERLEAVLAAATGASS